MSKFVKLWMPAPVFGVMRKPEDGVRHLPDDEANRLITGAFGEDVTGDFSAEQRASAPVESPPPGYRAAQPEPPKPAPVKRASKKAKS